MDIFVRRTRYTGPVRAVILDWAGTTVDYGCIGPVAVFLEVFRRHGVEATLAEARAPMGLMKKDHIREMFRMEALAARWEAVHHRPPTEDDVEALYQETAPLMIAALKDHSTLIPGTLNAMREFRAMGLKIGSTTGYTRPMMDVLLPDAVAQGYRPDAVVTSTDVPAGRPYPFMCYANAAQLGVYPLEAVVKVGDTIADVQEGLNAGMWTVAVTRTSNELGMTQPQTEAMPPERLAEELDNLGARFKAAGAHWVAEGIWAVPDLVESANQRLALGELP